VPDLTLSEASSRTGLPRATLLAYLDAGVLPGARKVRGGAWAIPPESLDAVNRIDPAPSEGDGVDRDNNTARRTASTVADEPTPGSAPLGDLVDIARRVERATSSLSTSRPARAACDAVWRLVQAAARHEVDRDGACRQCGWAWPCPDRVDAVAAVLDAGRVVLEGADS
jgi:hypothetical protein